MIMEKKYVDINFVVDNSIDKTGLVFKSALEEPFSLHGVYYEDGMYRRLPESVAKSVNPGVHERHANTSGGRVRFKTNSKRIAISVGLPYIYRAPHFCLTGTTGLDLYAKRAEGKERYVATFVPPVDVKQGYESVKELLGDMVEVTINMPLYSDVSNLYIGIDEGAELLPPEPLLGDAPIVYYGNSITQGACVSRPGNAFAAIASRAVGYDFVNLGFSGWARGEDEMAEYIAGLKMSVFAYDYDHNAPTIEHLEKTHERMFKIIREKNPTLPIIIMTRSSILHPETRLKRIEIIKRTYDNAVAAGDENVYFIDGRTLFPDYVDEATVEGIHSNDLGHTFKAMAIERVLREIIAKK